MDLFRGRRCAVAQRVFTQTGQHNTALFACFTHDATGDPAVIAFTLIYELKLHHYVLHLQRSGSPYTFHALGSTAWQQ